MSGALRQRVEWLTRELEEPVWTGRDVILLVDVFVQTIRRHVRDPKTLESIADDLREQMSKPLDNR